MFARPNLGQNRVTWSGDVVVRPHQMLPLYQLTVIAGPGMLDLCMHWQSERFAPEYLTSTCIIIIVPNLSLFALLLWVCLAGVSLSYRIAGNIGGKNI